MFIVQDNFTDLLKKSSSNSPIEALRLVHLEGKNEELLTVLMRNSNVLNCIHYLSGDSYSAGKLKFEYRLAM